MCLTDQKRVNYKRPVKRYKVMGVTESGELTAIFASGEFEMGKKTYTEVAGEDRSELWIHTIVKLEDAKRYAKVFADFVRRAEAASHGRFFSIHYFIAIVQVEAYMSGIKGRQGTFCKESFATVLKSTKGYRMTCETFYSIKPTKVLEVIPLYSGNGKKMLKKLNGAKKCA